MKLFISYSRDDKAWVYDFYRALSETHNVWIDHKLVVGVDWWSSICENIENADCFLYIITPKSLASIYCQAELDFALALNKPVLPICLKSIDVPEILHSKQIFFLNDFATMDKVLLVVERGLSQVREDSFLGKYNPKRASRPTLPRPINKEEALEVFLKAIDAEGNNEIDFAKKLYGHITKVDPDGLGKDANERLKKIWDRERRSRVYSNLAALAKKLNDETQEAVLAALQKYIDEYGEDYDPENTIKILKRLLGNVNQNTPIDRSITHEDKFEYASDIIEPKLQSLPTTNLFRLVKLIIKQKDDNDNILEYTMSSDKITIGRYKDKTISLPQRAVSRNHAVVWLTDDKKIFIKDLGSTYGTRIGNVGLSPHKDYEWVGDSFVQIGDYIFELEFVPFDNNDLLGEITQLES